MEKRKAQNSLEEREDKNDLLEWENVQDLSHRSGTVSACGETEKVRFLHLGKEGGWRGDMIEVYNVMNYVETSEYKAVSYIVLY